MTSEEIRSAGRLAGRAFGGVVSQVEQVHQAIAKRAFGPTRLFGLPARTVHDAIARAVYGGLRGGGSTAGASAGHVMSAIRRDHRQAGATPSTNLALAAVNAVAGDRLADEGDPLAIRMAVRRHGLDVAVSGAELLAAFRNTTGKIAVFVHGLGETDDSWRPGKDPTDRVSYGAQLQAELGYTPVFVRYNTGRHVSDNGADLAQLIAGLTDAWPVPLEELLLVGHSMGGLVIRSACHSARTASEPWVRSVRHIFYLGSPHLGAPLARGAGVLGKLLALAPETRAFAPLVNGSSAGVKDLRYGYLLPEDWADCKTDTCLRNHRHDSPLLDTANHYTFSVTVTIDSSHPLGRLVGDLLVQPASAQGRRRSHQHLGFAVDNGRELGGMHHFDLLRHRDIWAEMHSLLVRSAEEASTRS
jgi:pimeloyl-ACP methyl ester carboxylesterase